MGGRKIKLISSSHAWCVIFFFNKVTKYLPYFVGYAKHNYLWSNAGRLQELPDGAALIKSVKALQADLKLWVFSSEGNAVTIDALFKNLQINGFVRKATRDAEQLKIAFGRIADGRSHYPPELTQMLRQNQSHDFLEMIS